MTTRIALILIVAVLGASTAAAEPPPANEPAPPTDEEMTLAKGNTQFALELHRQLTAAPADNLFTSPLSISTALAMTYAGARGNTATEMARTLHFAAEGDQLHAAFAKLLHGLEPLPEADGYRLKLANALWLHQGYSFLPEFLQIGQTQYAAGLHTVDFVNALEPARQSINTWVAQRTEDKIRELIPPGILDAQTRLVLTNAIYFKGQWARRFEERATREAPFTLADGTQVSVPLMHQTGEMAYLERNGLQVLELPYAGERLSMVVLLPRAADGLPALEGSLEPPRLAELLSSLRQREVQVFLPRFMLRSAVRLDNTLQAMGMRDAFRAGAADFSGMDGTRDLYIGAVLHEAFVEVNEQGTEAAGATAVVQKIRAAPTERPVFRADRPFLFLIRDVRSGSVLFLGRLANPRA
jgi:serpin B